MWKAIQALVIKEILIILRDKKSRITLIAPPLMQLFIFAHAATLEVRNIAIGIYNEDLGWYGHEIVERISGSHYFRDVYQFKTIAQVKSAIDTQKVIVAVRIPQDFSRQIAMGNSGSIQTILDGRKTNASQIVAGYLTEIFQTFDNDIIKIETGDSGLSSDTIFRSWFNVNLDYILYTVPCLVGILSMVLAINLTALSVAREREIGTFDQLLVSPLQPWQILIGKTLPSLLIGVTESICIMFIALFSFGIPFEGSLLIFLFSLIIFVASVIGVGLFISSISKTQQQASLGAFVFMVPAMLLSGYATPIENMPTWLQPVSQILPNTHIIIIIKGVFLKAMPASEVLQHTWPMLLIGLFTLTVAGWMFTRRLE